MSEELPAPENGTIDGVNKILRIVIDASGAAAKGALVTVAPFFGWPVVSQLTDFILGKFKDALFKAISESTTFVIIDIQEAKKLHAYVDELQKLKEAMKVEDPESEKKALEDARAALGKLIRFGA